MKHTPIAATDYKILTARITQGGPQHSRQNRNERHTLKEWESQVHILLKVSGGSSKAGKDPELLKNKETQSTHNLSTDARPLKSQFWGMTSLPVTTLGTDNKVSKRLALKYFKKWAEVRGSSFPLQCISNIVQNSWQRVSVFLTEGTHCLLGKKTYSEALTTGKPIKIPTASTQAQTCDSGTPQKQSFLKVISAQRFWPRCMQVVLWRKANQVTEWLKSATRKP